MIANHRHHHHRRRRRRHHHRHHHHHCHFIEMETNVAVKVVISY